MHIYTTAHTFCLLLYVIFHDKNTICPVCLAIHTTFVIFFMLCLLYCESWNQIFQSVFEWCTQTFLDRPMDDGWRLFCYPTPHHQLYMYLKCVQVNCFTDTLHKFEVAQRRTYNNLWLYAIRTSFNVSITQISRHHKTIPLRQFEYNKIINFCLRLWRALPVHNQGL